MFIYRKTDLLLYTRDFEYHMTAQEGELLPYSSNIKRVPTGTLRIYPTDHFHYVGTYYIKQTSRAHRLGSTSHMHV